MAHQHTYQQMQQVQSELSLFLKRVRQRQEEHNRIYEFTSRLLIKQEKPLQQTANKDQLAKSRNFYKQRLTIQVRNQELDSVLASKCESFVFEEEDNLLTKRLAARVIQLTYNLELKRQSNDYYNGLYAKFKQNCLQKLGQLGSKPAWIIRLTNKYLTQKLQSELQRLRKSINLIQLNDQQSLISMRNNYYQDLRKKQMLTTFSEKSEGFNIFQRLAKRERNDNPERVKQVRHQAQVRLKIKSSKQQQKLVLKTKGKILKKLATCLSQVMDVCRQQLLQGLAPQNKAWETRRMMTELISRNKNNQTFINIFREKQPLYIEKIEHSPPAFMKISKVRCQSLEQQLLENTIQEQQHITTTFTTKELRISQSMLNRKVIPHQTRYDKKQISRFIPKSGFLKKNFSRQRATVNNIPETQKLNKEKQIFSSQKLILSQQQFVQIRLKAAIPLPKARFPQINSRVFSLDKAQTIKKQQVIKPRMEMKTTGGNFFQQIQKRISKFCQIKRNILIS